MQRRGKQDLDLQNSLQLSKILDFDFEDVSFRPFKCVNIPEKIDIKSV